MKLEAIQAAEAKLLLPTYERNPILFVEGQGMHLIDEKGERYLDLLSGIGVNALGYAHPAVTKTIEQQSRKLVHTSNLSPSGCRSAICAASSSLWRSTPARVRIPAR